MPKGAARRRKSCGHSFHRPVDGAHPCHLPPGATPVAPTRPPSETSEHHRRPFPFTTRTPPSPRQRPCDVTEGTPHHDHGHRYPLTPVLHLHLDLPVPRLDPARPGPRQPGTRPLARPHLPRAAPAQRIRTLEAPRLPLRSSVVIVVVAVAAAVDAALRPCSLPLLFLHFQPKRCSLLPASRLSFPLVINIFGNFWRHFDSSAIDSTSLNYLAGGVSSFTVGIDSFVLSEREVDTGGNHCSSSGSKPY